MTHAIVSLIIVRCVTCEEGFRMNIMVAFNDGYTLPTKVMLKSLIINNTEELHIYVLYTKLSSESIDSIKELDDGNRVFITMLQIDDHLLDGVPVMKHFSKEAYIRLFAHLILDESIDRILWLDGDMIINGSLSYFYNLDFEDKIFIAEKDIEIGDSDEKKKSLGMPSDVDYINSGVLLINLTEARKRLDDKVIRDFVREHKDAIQFVDQDVFNGCLYKEFKVVDTSHLYNFFSRYIFLDNKKYVYKNAHVIHYAGRNKPWKKGYTYGGFRIWWKYAFRSGPQYKMLFIRILPSGIKGKMIHGTALFTKSKMPGVYDKLVKLIKE